jgi:hypothetical protein
MVLVVPYFWNSEKTRNRINSLKPYHFAHTDRIIYGWIGIVTDINMDGTIPNRHNSSRNLRNSNTYADPYESSSLAPAPTISRNGLNFPAILHMMLKFVEEDHHDGLSAIVSWQPHGRCFVVHRVPEFVRRFLNRYGLKKSTVRVPYLDSVAKIWLLFLFFIVV